MNARPSLFGTSGNPLLQALSLLVFGLLLIGAVVMGAVILGVVLAFAVIVAIAFYARLWWLRRKLSRSAAERGAAPAAGKLIDAEYTVVEQRDPGYPTDGRPRSALRRDSDGTDEQGGDRGHSGRAGR
jgi:hypothetical protein